MSRLGGFITSSVVDQQNYTLEAAGGSSTPYGGTSANAAYFRVVKNAGQAGGATPVAYITVDGDAPTSANGFPLYDGDAMWIYEGELKNARLASADAYQPTVCVISYNLS